jgi:protein O-GlcNAc transferase
MQSATMGQRLVTALQHAKRGDEAAATRDFHAVILQAVDQPDANVHLGQYAKARGDVSAARGFFTHAVAGVKRAGRHPMAVAAFAELASLEHDAGDAAAALTAARAGQALCGEQPWLLWEECQALRLAGRADERLRRLNRLALLQPNDRVILVELGLALLGSASATQAIIPLRRAIELGYHDTEVSLALAGQEMATGAIEIAQARLHDLRHAAPTHLGVLGLCWYAHQRQCQWALAQPLEAALLRRIAAGEQHPAITPFMLLMSSASPRLLCDFARSRTHEGAPMLTGSSDPAASASAHGAPPDSSRPLRVGYLSADLHEHATAILMAGLFEHHDRSRFEVFAYSYGPRVDDAYRSRLRAALPHWRDVNDLSDPEAAATIKGDALDVLVELKGHTLGVRLGITAHRPAPVTLHYLGYPGTMASGGIDFLLADAITVPAAHEGFYAEKILRMPCSYQVNDQQRARPAALSRAALGLPQDALLLCNFNQSVKWTAPFFNCWLRALQAAPHAHLWLLDPGAAVRDQLIGHAAAVGVAAQILWAPRLAPAAHLARLAAADLALDQLPYASHTTGADALWMGVPLLTCLGEAFHGRVGASLLHAVELPALITQNMDDYEQHLHQLLANPAPIKAAQQHLRANYQRLPLFDTAQFTRDWEAMLTDVASRPS